MSDKKGQAVPTRDRLDHRQKEFMMAHMLRLPALFADAKVYLTPEMFDADTDGHLAAVWRAAMNVADSSGGVLPHDGLRIRLEIEAAHVIERDPSFFVTAEGQEQLFGPSGLFEWVFGLDQSDMRLEDGRLWLTMYLEERTVLEPLRAVQQSMGADLAPKDAAGLLHRYAEQLGRLGALGHDPGVDPFPADWHPSKAKIFSTGIDFLDVYMSGGHGPGEVAVINGCTGTGKTSTGVMLCVRGVEMQNAMAEAGVVKEPGVWFYFTYETPVIDDLRMKVWSCAADIHADSLLSLTSLADFSRPDSLKPYERDRYASVIRAGGVPPCEKDRFENARRLISNRLILVDMSGSGPNPAVGSGGVEEIGRIMRMYAERGVRIAGYVVDYARIAITRHMAAKNAKDDHLRHYLTRFVDECRRHCSAPFGAAGWVMQQLSGAANARLPTARQHHTDSAECKTFCDNAWFAFNLGCKDFSNNTCIISCSKTRRGTTDGKERVLWINGAFSRLELAEDRFVADPKTRRIVDVKEASAVMGGVEDAKRDARKFYRPYQSDVGE